MFNETNDEFIERQSLQDQEFNYKKAETAYIGLNQLKYLAKADKELKLSEFNLYMDIFACKLLSEELKHKYITHNCCVYKIAEYLGRAPTTIYRYANALIEKGFASKGLARTTKPLFDNKINRYHKFYFHELDADPRITLNYAPIDKSDVRSVLQSKEFTSFESLIYMTVVFINHDANRSLNRIKDNYGFYKKTSEILKLLEIETTKANMYKTQKAMKKFADKGLIKRESGYSDICPNRSQDFKTIHLTNEKYNLILRNIIRSNPANCSSDNKGSPSYDHDDAQHHHDALEYDHETDRQYTKPNNLYLKDKTLSNENSFKNTQVSDTNKDLSELNKKDTPKNKMLVGLEVKDNENRGIPNCLIETSEINFDETLNTDLPAKAVLALASSDLGVNISYDFYTKLKKKAPLLTVDTLYALALELKQQVYSKGHKQLFLEGVTEDGLFRLLHKMYNFLKAGYRIDTIYQTEIKNAVNVFLNKQDVGKMGGKLSLCVNFATKAGQNFLKNYQSNTLHFVNGEQVKEISQKVIALQSSNNFVVDKLSYLYPEKAKNTLLAASTLYPETVGAILGRLERVQGDLNKETTKDLSKKISRLEGQIWRENEKAKIESTQLEQITPSVKKLNEDDAAMMHLEVEQQKRDQTQAQNKKLHELKQELGSIRSDLSKSRAPKGFKSSLDSLNIKEFNKLAKEINALQPNVKQIELIEDNENYRDYMSRIGGFDQVNNIKMKKDHIHNVADFFKGAF